MEMWCPDDIGRDSWDWVGPPTWEREWGGGSSPVKNGASPDCIIVAVAVVLRGRRGSRQPENSKRAHFRVLAFKHHQNSTKGPQERERRKKIVTEEGKKSAKFWTPHPSGPNHLEQHPSGPQIRHPTLRGPTLRGPTPFGAPPFGCLRAPQDTCFLWFFFVVFFLERRRPDKTVPPIWIKEGLAKVGQCEGVSRGQN